MYLFHSSNLWNRVYIIKPEKSPGTLQASVVCLQTLEHISVVLLVAFNFQGGFSSKHAVGATVM